MKTYSNELINTSYEDLIKDVNSNDMNYNFEYDVLNEKYNKGLQSDACKTCPNYLNSKRNGTILICHCTLGSPKIIY